MPRKPTGTIYESHGHWYAKILIAPDQRAHVTLTACADRADAISRRDILATLAAELRAATAPIETIEKVLAAAGSRTGKARAAVLDAAAKLCRGEVQAKPSRVPPVLLPGGVPLERAPRSAGVYFVRQDVDGLIKIGFASNIRARVCSFQTANPSPLRFLGAVIGAGLDDEAALHARFADLRARREWFRPGAELLAFIASTHGAPPRIGA
jgi:hypothetical protein